MDWKTKAAQLARTGESWRSIANALGVPKSTVSDYLRGRNIMMPEFKQRTKRAIVIPDTQCKPGLDYTYLRAIGNYIAYKQPDYIIHLGDHADMPSLSSYDKGKKKAEGKRVGADLEAQYDGMCELMNPIERSMGDGRGWVPEKHILLGNHEERIMRHVEANPELDGFLGYDSLHWDDFELEVHDFLQPAIIQDTTFIHYYPNPLTGKPLGGSAANMLQKVGTSVVQGHVQLLDVATRTLHTGNQQWAIKSGACLAPEHRVLTADLRYIPLGDVQVGQKLVSFDEYAGGQGRGRRFKTGTVLAVRRKVGPMLEVTLSSGKTFKTTPDHRWLTTNCCGFRRWQETQDFRKTGTHRTKVERVLDVWDTDTSYEAGWLAGMYDGEGCLYTRKTTGGVTVQLGISQSRSHNPELCDRLVEAHTSRGFQTREDHRTGSSNWRIQGGRANVARLLGSIRPHRMLSKFSPEMLGSLANKVDFGMEEVVSVERIGNSEYIEIDIDEKTMVVDGYPHHNCYLHDEDYKGYTGNKHWRGLLVLNGFEDGSFDPLFVRLDYLVNRFGGKV